MPAEVPEGLERSTDRFQSTMWTLQRIAWAIGGLGLIAAAIGLAGPAPASAVLRPLAIYGGIFALLRLTGKHSLGAISTFDFVLLLIISEAVSNALLAGDNAISSALLAAGTLVFVDIVLSLVKRQSRFMDRLIEDEPIILVTRGRVHRERLRKERVDEDDILEAARRTQGLERMEQIRFAVLERGGDISIIPEKA